MKTGKLEFNKNNDWALYQYWEASLILRSQRALISFETGISIRRTRRYSLYWKLIHYWFPYLTPRLSWLFKSSKCLLMTSVKPQMVDSDENVKIRLNNRLDFLSRLYTFGAVATSCWPRCAFHQRKLRRWALSATGVLPQVYLLLKWVELVWSGELYNNILFINIDDYFPM